MRNPRRDKLNELIKNDQIICIRDDSIYQFIKSIERYNNKY